MEIRKLVKPKGIVIVSTPNLQSYQSRITYALFGFPNTFNEEIKKYGHVSPIFKNTFRFISKETKFSIVKREGVGTYIQFFWWRPFHIMVPYFLIRMLFSILLFSTRVFNRKLLKGFSAVYVLKKKINK